MKKRLFLMAMSAVLAACANGGSGSSEMYGVISGGVESSRSF